MKKINTIVGLLIAIVVCAWMYHTIQAGNSYVIGSDRFAQAGFRKPKLLRNIESFFTLSDDPNPYTALDDLLETDLKNSRVAFLLGSPSSDIPESAAFYGELKTAIGTGNIAMFDQIVDKYAIDYVVYDPQAYDKDKHLS